MHSALKLTLASATLTLLTMVAPLAARAAVPGELVKIACPGAEAADHPCRAVYFYGGDGRRHAFPNAHVYFTWYTNFNGVKTISNAEMAAIRLGENVTYRPGSKFVKFLTDNKVYAPAADRTLRWVTSEQAATAIFGGNWAKEVDDIPDVFYGDYVFGAAITDPGSYVPATEKAAAPNIDANLPDSYRAYRITTDRGAFDIKVAKLRKARFNMVTDVAENDVECANDCDAKSLADYATANGALIGMHGSYFCPPDYADCQGKTNTFLSPWYRTSDRTMFEVFGLQVHKGPLLAYFSNGNYQFIRSADSIKSVTALESQQGAQLVAAASNYPALMEGGAVVVESEPRLDDGQRNNKGSRAGLGMNDQHVFLVTTTNATVIDLAAIFAALGARDALNLDGGGTTALLYGGAYKAGPGRLLPNAVLFTAK